VTSASAVAFTALAAFAERKASIVDASSRALQGPTFGLVVPLATFSLVVAATGRTRFDHLLAPLAVLGTNRRYAALGAISSIAIVAAFLAIVCSTLTLLVTNRGVSSAMIGEAVTCMSLAALSAFAYTSLYCLGSTWGLRGGGRSVVLFVDLLAGSSPTMASIPFPKAHALNYLGATPSLPIAQPASLLALGLIGVIAAALTTRRVHA
jgi:hypothetical protein